MRPLAYILAACATLALAAGAARAQHAGGAGHHGGGGHHAGDGHEARVDACLKEFEAVVAEGRGFGLAFAADQNGYPGPLHVLELKDRLRLSGEQEATMRALLHAMFAEARPKGARLVEAEARLRRLFSGRAADDAAVRAAVADIERARSEVRLVHLLTHLRTRDVLTEEQRRLYHEARWAQR